MQKQNFVVKSTTAITVYWSFIALTGLTSSCRDNSIATQRGLMAETKYCVLISYCGSSRKKKDSFQFSLRLKCSRCSSQRGERPGQRNSFSSVENLVFAFVLLTLRHTSSHTSPLPIRFTSSAFRIGRFVTMQIANLSNTYVESEVPRLPS